MFYRWRPKNETISEISIKNVRSGRTLGNNYSGGRDGKGGEVESNYPRYWFTII